MNNQRDSITLRLSNCKLAYLKKALDKFIQKIEKENISSFEDYDRQHKIHYRSKEWVEKLRELIKENQLEADNKAVLKDIKEFSNKLL